MGRERRVWIINEPKGDRLTLGKFGAVTHLCPGWIENKDLALHLATLVQTLEAEHEDPDLMVFGGHAKLNMVAFHLVLKKHSVLRQLLPTRQSWFQLTHDERNNADGTARTNWWLPG